MTNTNKGLSSLYITLFALILFFNGCEDPGNVGSGFIDEPTVKIDTLYLDDITTENLEAYSGNLANINIGQYSDQLLGDIRTVGLMKPVLHNLSTGSDFNSEDFSIKLEIQLDSTLTYGDTSSVSDFTIYETSSLWRGNSLRINDAITYNESEPVGSFSVNTDKRFTVGLSETWKDKYATYLNSDDANADSLYRYEFFGLAIVPDNNGNKVSIVDRPNLRFIMVDAADDTIGVGLSSSGYFLERTNSNSGPADAIALHSTLEQMMRINLPMEELKEGYNDKNILKAELVLHEANDVLAASLPENHVRPPVNELTLNLGVNSEQVYQYQITGPDFVANRNTDNPYFSTSMTAYLNNVFFGGETNSNIYVGLRSSSGVLRSTYIYNQTASQELRPKLIITTAVNEEN
ncbi:MAG: hypothetical protein WD053_04265 [Gracilimonas sp.]